MKIYFQESLLSENKIKYLFLDNTTLILFLNYIQEFSDFIAKLKSNGCVFLTISSVVFEFSRTDSIEGYNKRISFLETYVDTIYPIEKHKKDFTDLILILQKIKGKLSYSDFLLYCCLYKFPDAHLITENHSDFSVQILDRTNILSIDTQDDQIRNTATYTFSKEKYANIAEKLLKQT